MNFFTRTAHHILFAFVLLVPACALAQIPADGSFESGGLASWTIGGDNRAGAVNDAAVGGTFVVPDGTWAAAISSGPGARASGPLDFDGFGGNNDYDLSWLETTMNFNFTPAFIAFDWAFASSEQNEPDQFDDVLDVLSNGTRIFSRSSCKLNGSSYSPFANASCQNATVVNNTITSPAALNGVNLRFGPPSFQRVCLQLPNTVAGPNTVALRFRVADANDRNVDSTFFIDNVQLRTSCNEVGSVTQLTTTAGSTVEVKGGGLQFRAAAAHLVANDATGTNVAFATSANHGSNPNLLDQIYVWNGTTFTRASGLTMQSNGGIQGLAMTALQDGNGTRGRYLAIAARLTDTDNNEIYRYDRTSNTMTTITTTAGCDNTNPTIDGDGDVVAFESTCNALTGAGTTKKLVIWNGTTNSAPFGTTANCSMRNPSLTKNANGRYLAFESQCAHSGANADLNYEIYRYDRTGNSFVRITTTTTNATGADITQNTSPVMDGSSTGLYIYFLSDGNLTPTAPIFNSDFSTEIFRYQVGAGTPLTQRTNSSDSEYIGVDVDIDGNLNYSYERISTLNFQFSIGRRRVNLTAGAPDPENNIVTTTQTQGARIGLDGIVPVVNFLSAADILGTNTELNTEVWQGRVQ